MSKDLSKRDGLVVDWRRDYHAAEKYKFIHRFLPRAEENKRSVLLSTKSLIVYCALVLIITGLFRVIPLIFPNVLGFATNINVSDLLTETNKKRSEFGLASLKYSNTLSEAAKKKAEHMFKNGYWAHVAPDGTEPWDFILGENYDYIYAGENLAKNFNTSGDVVEAWYNSPSHKENLLNKNYTEMGFAIVDGKLNGYETTLVVQMFGKPRLPVQVAEVPEGKPAVEANPVPVEETPEVVPADSNVEPAAKPVYQEPGDVKPLMDIRIASRWLTLIMGGFVAFLLGLDIWYSSKKGIIKLGGHTIVHLSFLILALVGIWIVLVPGSIL